MLPYFECFNDKLLVRNMFYIGFIGPILFIAIFLIEGWRRTEYKPIYHMVSSLSTGSYGWIQISNFILCGISILVLVAGLRMINDSGNVSRFGLVMMIILGVSLIGAGIFVTDPVLGYPISNDDNVTLTGTLHNIFSLVVFISLPIVITIMLNNFSDEFSWKGWLVYSIITLAFYIIFLISFVMASVLLEMGKINIAPIGLLQRITIIIGWSWIAVFSFLLKGRVG